MTTVELERIKVINLSSALGILSRFPVQSKVRYAIKRTQDSLAPEIAAINAAFPPSPTLEANEEYNKHVNEKVKVDIETVTDFPDLDYGILRGMWPKTKEEEDARERLGKPQYKLPEEEYVTIVNIKTQFLVETLIPFIKNGD